MTSLKPQLIRADTLDLQSPESPSAKDHRRQPQNALPAAQNVAAPHQNQTLRSVEKYTLQEQMNGPTLSHNPGRDALQDEPDFYDDPDEDGPDASPFQHKANVAMHPAEDSGVDDSDIGDQVDDEGLDDELMDRLSSSPSIDDDEDIDFEFVYALHTFVATVEGQANATKGDTMVLLDDSNSYWWLVRVVKDGSIGYLPAEHIETPTERLARLNKRRNIDLSATMLSDNAEKSKNPLKKAMRRRNAKTVQFSTPQYFEPSDVDYSDEEDDMDEDFEKVDPTLGSNDQSGMDADEENADGVSAFGTKDDQKAEIANGIQPLQTSERRYGETVRRSDNGKASDEISSEDRQEDLGGRSKRGLVRNTDSFLKDDGIETKKISLTPRLLQVDSDPAFPAQEPEPRPKSSVESFDKLMSPESERSGDEKKKKEKKGMLGGFFKRKEKKGRLADSEVDEGKRSTGDVSWVMAGSKKSPETLAQDTRPVKGDRGFQRQSSKLQKQPPPHVSPKMSPSKDNLQKVEQDSIMSPSSQDSSSTPSTLQSLAAEQSRAAENVSRSRSPETNTERPVSPSGRRTIFTSMTDAFKSGPRRQQEDGREEEGEVALAKAARGRGENADTGPGDDATLVREQSHERLRERSRERVGEQWREGSRHRSRERSQERFRERPQDRLGGQSREHSREQSRERTQVKPTPAMLVPPPTVQGRDRLSESPIEVSPIEPWEGAERSWSESQAPDPMVDPSSNSERRSVSPISPTSSSSSRSSSSSPSLVDADDETPNEADELTNPTATSSHADAPTPSTARSTPTWSDASLRTYMDNDEDIRDLLIIVHDKSNVVPAGPEHPITGNLFNTEKGRLADMQANLDSMLTNWLARKNSAMLSR